MARYKITYVERRGFDDHEGEVTVEADTLSEALFSAGTHLGAKHETGSISLGVVYKDAGWIEVEMP